MEHKIPKNYQEWMDCLNILQNSRMELSEIVELKHGVMTEDAAVIQRFVQRLAETLSIMINGYIKKFIKNINEALESGEYDSLLFLFRRFRSQMNCCLFFEELEFIPQEMKEQMEEQMIGQVSQIWKKLILNLKMIQEETGNPELDDLLYEIRRMKLFKDETGYGKLRYDKTGS